MRFLIFCCALLLSLPLLAAEMEADAVLLRGVDKITGHTKTFRAALGEEAAFGDLTIIPRRCLKKPPEEMPENKAFLQIYERSGTSLKPVFRGWMFSSNPALSAMEHPIYDIWVLECLLSSPPPSEEEPAPEILPDPIVQTEEPAAEPASDEAIED